MVKLLDSSPTNSPARVENPGHPLVPRLERILDQIDSLLLLVESDGTLSYWNEPSARRLGGSARDPIGRPFLDLVHPKDVKKLRKVFDDIFMEESLWKGAPDSELSFRLKGVNDSWLYCLAQPSVLEIPDPPHSVCLLKLREDCERRQEGPLRVRVQELVEEVEAKSRRLAESEADYRALIQAMNDGFWVLSPDSRILFVNEKLASLLGYSPSKLIGKSAINLFDEPNREIFLQQTRERLQGKGGTYEIRMARKDGIQITCLMRGAPRLDSEGKSVGSICNITDISSRKLLEDRLRTSEKEYRDLFENMQDVVCRMSPEGKILAINLAGARVLGHDKPNSLLGRKLQGFCETRSDWKYYEKMLEEKSVVEDHVIRFRRRDNLVVALSINAQIVLDEKGRPLGVDAVFRDVTERITMERQLQSYAQDMEKKNEELESLIYSITHDFKSPLLVIGGLLGRLKKVGASLLDNKSEEYLEWMRLNVTKMEMMVNDMLVFYRADKTLVPFELVSIGSLVETVLRDIEPLAKEKGIHIRKQGTFPVVSGYRNRLYQVLYNLVENAIKYMDHGKGAQVEIGCQTGEKEHCLFVRDTGPGIPREHQDKIFQIFFTLEPEQVSGTGIGLSIVKKIVENHGGRIWVESEPAKGTTFFFTLPAKGSV